MPFLDGRGGIVSGRAGAGVRAVIPGRQGRGIAIVPSIVPAQQGGMQGLTIPCYSDMRSAGEYYMIVLATKRMDSRVQQFRSWILSEAALTTRRSGTR
jgi:LysR family transcriptional regulator, glycine cleavage system transcriptional activator